MRWPCSLRADSIASFIFLEIVEMKPLIVCGCQWVSLAISAADTPSLRRRNSITAPFFDPSRASGLRGLAAGLACFAPVSFRLDGAQNLSPEARHLRAQGAAEARWARARAQARIDSAADQIRDQQPHLSHAQAVAEALKHDPSLCAEYSAAHNHVGSGSPLQLGATSIESPRGEVPQLV